MAARAKKSNVTSYVALLRGINVGGNNIIPMRALAKTFEQLGFANVKTYIASGNVLFDSDARDARSLEVELEKAVTRAHDYDARIVIRTRDEMKKVVAGLPASWKKVDPDVRYYVLFLRHEIDSKELLAKVAAKPDLEEVSYRPGVLYWSAHREVLTRTSMSKLPSSPIYKHVTIRNLNTTRKICELLCERE